jgi:ABC-type tungstate transport system substrate-binding protein
LAVAAAFGQAISDINASLMLRGSIARQTEAL